VNPETTPWAVPLETVLNDLKTSESGLTTSEVSKRLKEYGFNQIEEKEKRQGLDIFISQFKNALILILMGAAAVSYVLGEKVDTVVLLSIILLTSLLGFSQEYRAEKAVRELKTYLTFKSSVLRNGKPTEIDSKEIVPGDIVVLHIGDIVPADIRLIQVDELTTDESAFTGESLPVVKRTVTLSQEHTEPQYLENMVFMGTSIASGSGQGVVTTTGSATFFGKTASYLMKTPESDFQKNMRNFSNFLLKVVLVMTVFIFLSNAILGKGTFDSFLFAVALAVAITPEALPIVISITLSNGALRMAKEKVITKRLASVEDFGNIDVLCCDKTGTLTEGRVTLQDYRTVDGEHDDTIILFSLLCSSTQGGGKNLTGNPIDTAVWQSKKAAELENSLKSYDILDTNEFDFERRRMSVLVKSTKSLLIAKGAPESILDVCKTATVDRKRTVLTKDLHTLIGEKVSHYENDGYRVIAVAEKDITKTDTKKEDETELNFLGFLLFLDPPKKTAKNSLKMLQGLGVTIKVLSGDSPVITRKICDEVALTIAEDTVVTGKDLEVLQEDEYAQYAQRYNVFARITPEQKYRIVSYLNRTHIVGFLGDGVNDAPALKAAEVGISVDSATGIAKEAADIILLKKSLKVLAEGITQGRKTFGNITKYILNTMSANYGNMLTVAASSLFLKFIPLLPPQILLNNFVSDIPLLTIATDNVDKELLQKPRRWNIPAISRFMVWFGLISVFFDLLLIVPLVFLMKVSPELFRTAWFLESALSEMIVTFAIRTKLPFFKSRPSRWLMGASLITGAVTIVVTYMPVGNLLFEFEKLTAPVVALIAGVLLAYFTTTEVVKRWFFRRVEI
jgi:Mg2+-importing ATPase